MKHDEWILTKEMKVLRNYGFRLQAERTIKDSKNHRYNIVFENTKEILEPNCSIEEVMGIINSLKTCFDKIIEYNKKR